MIAEQLTLPGLDAGRAQRDAGLDSLERHGWIKFARGTALLICCEKGEVTTDDLQERLTPPEGVHHNVWGAVLRAPHFRKIGATQSKRPEARARWIHVWVPGPKPLTDRDS